MIYSTRFQLGIAGILAVALFPTSASAQFRGRSGPIAPPPAIVPFRGVSPPPVIMPATVARQSALPLIAPPVSPILNRTIFPNGTFGGFGGFYYPPYDYSQPTNITINYNNIYSQPEPYYPPRNFAVPPAAPNSNPYSARLTLTVPSGADVYIGGKKMDVQGTRVFESPELANGEIFTFDVRVTWKENGKEVEEKRSLSMKAGEYQSLQYLAVPLPPVKLEK